MLRKAGGHGLLVAKIERAEAIKNLAAVVKASDGVMVARGDLGVEMGYAELAGLQKQIIQEARHQNQRRDHGDADDGVDDHRTPSRRAPRCRMSPMPSWTAPMR